MGQKNSFLFLLIFLVILLAGAAAGFIAGRHSSARPVSLTSKALEPLFNNSIIVPEWYARVEGELAEKTATTITLKNGNAELTFPLTAQLSTNGRTEHHATFLRSEEAKSGATPHPLALEDIAIGTRLSGNIVIRRDGTIYGTIFLVE